MKDLILGNGFNFDLSLETRYSDFSESTHYGFTKNVYVK